MDPEKFIKSRLSYILKNINESNYEDSGILVKIFISLKNWIISWLSLLQINIPFYEWHGFQTNYILKRIFTYCRCIFKLEIFYCEQSIYLECRNSSNYK